MPVAGGYDGEVEGTGSDTDTASELEATTVELEAGALLNSQHRSLQANLRPPNCIAA